MEPCAVAAPTSSTLPPTAASPAWWGSGLPRPSLLRSHLAQTALEVAALGLLGDDLALGVDARAAPGVVEEEQGEQAGHLALRRQQLAQEPAQADGLAAQLAPHERVAGRRRVALVEDEVHDAQRALEALGQA